MAAENIPTAPDMAKIVSLCQRRGFIFQSSEIYGGLSSCWDYGPLGVELKRNVKEAWWRANVLQRDDVAGIDSSILMHPKVWEASGHVQGFSDPLIECKACNQRFRADHIWVIPVRDAERKVQGFVSTLEQDKDNLTRKAVDLSKKFSKSLHVPEPSLSSRFGRRALLQNMTSDIARIPCPACETVGKLTEPRQFNLMFKTFMGPVEEQANVVYMRPETAQGIFVNFQNVLNSTRKKLPFGIAQIGKTFRNEITTGNFIFRSREFEQMEIEFFVKPGTENDWLQYWLERRLKWYVDLGIKIDSLRLRKHHERELAHYAKACYDIEFVFPMGWAELEGIASRGNFDLTQHSNASGKDLSYYDEESKEHYLPFVIEPSAGVDRSVLAFLCNAYAEEPDKDETRVVLHLNPNLAPVKVAILPLSRKEPLKKMAKDIQMSLRRLFAMQYDDAQSIGRRYRRQDEIGTPLCVTIDFQSLEDNQVTIRDRDSMNQIRIPVDVLGETLFKKLAGEDFLTLPPGGSVAKIENPQG
ncbi:MAG: glycine--tRNA ligase [Dehalococcoidales bacterium]|nr:glycine--tRNA ligase [Dehalococcoidales bacterium]